MPNIIQLMIDRGILSRRELQRVMPSEETSEPPYRIALKTGLVSEEVFFSLLHQEMDIPVLEKFPKEYDPTPFLNISPLFMEEHGFFPLRIDEDAVSIAVSDPFDYVIFDTLKQIYGSIKIKPVLAREQSILSWINDHFMPEADESEQDEEELEFSPLIDEDAEHLKDLASEAPIIKMVNTFLTRAVEVGASDIHIEPFQDTVKVRFRIDGILREHVELPNRMQQGLISRIKIMARMDIAERRLPQDGRIRMKIAGKDIDLRVSSLPTIYGESVVSRILDQSQARFSLENLGFPEKELSQFKELIMQPYGIMLVTGPTGSGKTTTLYSALNAINSVEKKIITIEDPVEYELPSINQTQVNVKAGFTFASGLRSIVRQDPDVILVGEIRDQETAEIAIQSALTGHLVFSTLHTNDAAGAVTRLKEMGVENYLLSSSLLGILAQRLVRILCPACKKLFVPDASMITSLRLPFSPSQSNPVYKAKGCQRCHYTGYSGRIGIFELLMITDRIRSLILQNQSASAIRDEGIKQDMTLLREDGWEKVRAGITSIAEVLRVTGK